MVFFAAWSDFPQSFLRELCFSPPLQNHNIEVKASCESMLQNLFSKCNVNLHASNSSSSSSNQKGQTYCVKYSGGILNGSDLQSLNDQLKGVGSDEKASQST